jgi:hypothetical protein
MITTDAALEKISEIAFDNELDGYPTKSPNSMDIFFCQHIGEITRTIVIPWNEVADQAWPVIEARLNFYGTQKFDKRKVPIG